jgi:Holliday junction resolvase-like predicted endonuclease
LPRKFRGSYGIFVYTSRDTVCCWVGIMPLVSRLIFHAVHWAARKGLRETGVHSNEEKKNAARRTGIRGETYAYWYLRRHGYVFIARNFTPRASKGEIDMVGYDGDTLAFVEVRTRTMRDEMSALPELSITPGKQHVLARTAMHFVAERHVLAIDNAPGKPPVVRLHKDAFSPQM